MWFSFSICMMILAIGSSKDQILDDFHNASKFSDDLGYGNVLSALNNSRLVDVFKTYFRSSSLTISEIASGSLPSDRVAELLQSFQRIRTSFLQPSLEFKTIAATIDWKPTHVDLTNIERTMHILDEHLTHALQFLAKNSTEMCDYFIVNYESEFNNAAYELYSTMTRGEGTDKYNILFIGLNDTQNDRRKIHHLASGMIKFLFTTLQMEFAYYHLKGFKDNVKSAAALWSGRMEEVASAIHNLDDLVKARVPEQIETDVRMIAFRLQHLNNKAFVSEMYKLTADKYYWRAWFVLVFDENSKNDYAVKVCDGHVAHKCFGRTIVLASSEHNSTKFDQRSELDRLRATQNSKASLKPHNMLQFYRDTFHPFCQETKLAAFVCWGCGVWYIGETNHVAYMKMQRKMLFWSKNMNAITFG